MSRVAFIGVVAGLVAIAAGGRASLYHPTDALAIPVAASGEPQPLPFTEFSRRRLVLRNVRNPDWPLSVTNPQTKQTRLSERGVVAERIAAAEKKRKRTPEESVALAVDLLRFGRPEDAAGALAEQRRGFLPNVTLAHIAIAQNDWARAFTYLDIATEERPPVALPGLTPQQLAWHMKLNRGPLMTLVGLRLKEARGPKPAPEDEQPDRIFGDDFTKFPPDALATVQQLVLWFPYDTRLYWLLAEVYAAKGEFAAAKKIMDECVDSGHYSNRKSLMQRRETVTQAAKAKGTTPDEPLLTAAAPAPAPAADVPFSFGAVWLYFGVVGLVALFALVRALTKSKRRARVG